MIENCKEIVIQVKHRCIESSNFGRWDCVEYSKDLGRLKLTVEKKDPYDDRYSISELYVKHCPFCGYEAKK